MTTTNDTYKNSFDQDFCSYLEHHLCNTFKNSPDKNIQELWCDGVIHEPLTKSKSSIIDSRQLETKAWIGKDGQGEYEMTIKFGSDSLNKFSSGKDLTESVPSENTMDWINIDLDRKKIVLQLN